jgi:hypothetical protein
MMRDTHNVKINFKTVILNVDKN